MSRPEDVLRKIRRAVPLSSIVIAVFGIAVAMVVKAAVEDERDRLLEVQTEKVAELLESSVARNATELRSLLVVADETGPASSTFAALALDQLERNPAATAVAVVWRGELVASAGPQAPTGTVDGEMSEIARRALDADGLVSAVVDTTSAQPHLLFAVASESGNVVLRVHPVSGAAPIEYPPESPFADLHLDLYADDTASDQALVLTTQAERIRGSESSRRFPVGAEEWLLVTTPRTDLGGALASLVWLLVLGGAIFTAVMVGIINNLLRRRRAFALAMVDRKTSELQQALRQLAEARDDAERANRSKSEFLSRMSHELRTPLNSVMGFAQLLELGDLNDDQRSSTKQIRRAGDHLLALINEVLDISRIEAGTMTLSPEPVLVSELLVEVFDLHRPLADQTGVNLDLSLCDTCDHYVLADRQRVKQILINLVSNAIKYNRTNGSVSVRCGGGDNEMVNISISDTGPGIQADQLPMLFTPFERLGAERSGIHGTGIGLSLSKRLAEALGGDLRLETTGVAGSTFTLTLNEAEGPTDRYDRMNEMEDPDTIPEAYQPTLLYVDDNLENVRLVERILEQRRHIEVTSLMQGRQAVEIALTQRPNLILLDLHLPDVNGDEILRRLRSHPDTSDLPIVMLSADATPRQITRLLNAGATDYLTKPLDVRRLLQLIDEHIPEQHATTPRSPHRQR